MFERMKRNIKRATAFMIGIYLVLFLWLISPEWWVQIVEELPTWASIITWALPLILGGIAYYFVILDTHNWIDNKLFKERKKVNNYIRNQLISPCKEISCSRANNGILGSEEESLMNLFYTFIPPDDTERERAFAYWTEYFITVNLSAYSILGFVGALISIPFDLSRVIHPASFIILAFLLLFNLICIIIIIGYK